jgi:anhydro-N-acetylmuramic acid kinase
MLGGQGRLRSIGDRILFAEYDYCMNLGGFSNVFEEKAAELPLIFHQ